jgi:hypothetical protein
MTDVLQNAFSGEADRKVAEKNASDVAKVLGSKIEANKKIVLNDACYPFKIPIHSKQFHCFVFVSNVRCRFAANCRSPKGDVGNSCFFVSVKAPAPHMFAKTRVDELSKKLGVEVYRQPFSSDEEVEGAFVSKRTWELLRKVDFNVVSEFHLSPIQLGVAYSFQSAALCAERALLFRDLITVIFEQACEESTKGKG